MTDLRCGYLGPAGTFTEEAAFNYFKGKARFISLNSINAIFTGIKEGSLEQGVVPVENSLEGQVNITMDLLFVNKEITIIGEEVLPIRHFLLTPPGVKPGEIRKLYSHSQAIGQTNGYISRNLPGVEIYYTDSTARAAELIVNKEDCGMIGSGRISQLYNLDILAEDIQDHEANFTRFLVIGRKSQEKETRITTRKGESGDYKTSIICAPEENRAGVLYQILGYFARAGISLTRIESRPTKRQLGEYLFYIDFIGHKDDPGVKKALWGVEKQSGIFRLVGSYQRAKEHNKGQTDLQSGVIQRAAGQSV